MKVRKRAPRAILALAHHMMVVVFNVLKRRQEYVAGISNCISDLENDYPL